MFGMTVFESVLERLKAEAREAAGDAPEETVAPQVRSLGPGLAGLGAAGVSVSAPQAAAAYLELYEEPQDAEPEPDPPPAHLMRTTPEAVAEDLALTGREDIEALTARRRSFARENHPDRAPPALRGNATLRMKIANMLIDETIRRINVERSLRL